MRFSTAAAVAAVVAAVVLSFAFLGVEREKKDKPEKQKLLVALHPCTLPPPNHNYEC